MGECCDTTKKCCTSCTRKLTIETFYYNLMACSVLNKRNNNDSVGIFYLLFHLLLIHLHPDSIYISVLPFEFLDLMLRKTRFLSNVTLITDTSYSLSVVISERKTICLCVTGALEQGGKTMAPCLHTPHFC